ncbi:Hsp20/alpha crystallin family protein [Alicyclobacillus tolerans]|uniref:Hsp20/alpha crystallin family protein n=1 Tax=Alicyclobacillus tolerans TaxID=90970 RepID=UPI003B7FE936
MENHRDRLYPEMVPIPSSWFPNLWDDNWFSGWSFHHPRLDVTETSREVKVTAEIPGLASKDDISIVVHPRELQLSGKVQRESSTESDRTHRIERFYGTFQRTIPLPAEVDESSAKATYKNGLLMVTMTKRTPSSGQHKIDIEFH